MPRVIGLPLASIPLLTAACHSATAPADVPEAGRYVAQAVGARALPTLTDSSAEEFGTLLADTLELDGQGGGRRAFTVRRANTARGTTDVYRLAFPTEYRRSGTRLEVGRLTPCPPNALCLANDTGIVTARGILLATARYGRPGGGRVLLARVP